MKYSNRLYVTLLIMWYSLFSRQSGVGGPLPVNGSTAIPPEEISATLAEIGRLLRPDGTLELYFAGALPPAAPLLLYRLKSCGFSGCKAVMTDCGILLTARR